MAARLFCTLVLAHLLLMAVACSQRAARSDGDSLPLGNTRSDLPLHGIERIEPEALLAEVDPQTAARALETSRLEREKTAAASALDDVFFAFDSAVLDEDAMRALETNADWLLRHSGRDVQIEGHCDERGSAAYNLVLGEKRALAVRQYLVALGVPAERLTVTSYGKERPICLGHSEACYQKNRRGHLQITP
jgi:peptidoglycan-associated lipoprotein